MRPGLVLVCLVGGLVSLVSASCANLCDGHGQCNAFNACDCDEGYEGADCSLRSCPSGTAWSDHATGFNIAHGDALCSNRGLCNHRTGKCECKEGFEGKACGDMKCPANDGDTCSGRGKCMSLYELSSRTRNEQGHQFTYASNWDSHVIKGCVCDYMYTGHDCRYTKCPDGDDPLTTGQVNEKQAFSCTGTRGKFRLYFRGIPSPWIASGASALQVKHAIESIPEVLTVHVTFSSTGLIYACQSSAVVVTVEFLENFGNLPALVAEMDANMDVNDAAVIVSAGGDAAQDAAGASYGTTSGTKESDECAGRGFCVAPEGLCICFQTNGDAFDSSDGYGSAGPRGDCGFVKSTNKEVGACPGELECSGHGVCDKTATNAAPVPSFKCACAYGWTGGDCSERICPAGRAWFSYPTSNEDSHSQMIECSGFGNCDIATGRCKCDDGFTGEACQYSMCAGSEQEPCNGNGICITMAEAAERDQLYKDVGPTTYGPDPNQVATWDAHKIMHCLCDEGYSGYDCSIKMCPFGDDPETYLDVPERQVIKCTSGPTGKFVLSFRGEEITFPADATEEQWAATFNSEHSTVSSVVVQFVYFDGEEVKRVAEGGVGCFDREGEAPVVYAVVDFPGVHGNVPSLEVTQTFLLKGSQPGLTVYHSETVASGLIAYDGTTEHVECSNRGLCNRKRGLCECFENFFPSDGLGGEGYIPDCGHTPTPRLERRPNTTFP